MLWPVNEALLDTLVRAAARAALRHGLPPPEIAPWLALRGVAGGDETGESEEARDASASAFTAAFAVALEAVVRARAEEGARLAAVLAAHLATIERLTDAAVAAPLDSPPPCANALRSRCVSFSTPPAASMPTACIRRPS